MNVMLSVSADSRASRLEAEGEAMQVAPWVVVLRNLDRAAARTG